MTYPRTFSHLGIGVPDLEKAIEFYTKVFGWYLLVGPISYFEDRDKDRPIGRILDKAIGPGWTRLDMARLATGDRVGVELQQFGRPELRAEVESALNSNESHTDHKAVGVSHICVQDPDIEGLLKRVVEFGGKQLMPIMSFFPPEKPFSLVYCEDPFGNVIEIDSHSFEATWAPDAYNLEPQSGNPEGLPPLQNEPDR
jgi:catechol 2,3-dioxygenase-like lactoylglutathione lyase family enzyme